MKQDALSVKPDDLSVEHYTLSVEQDALEARRSLVAGLMIPRSRIAALRLAIEHIGPSIDTSIEVSKQLIIINRNRQQGYC